MISDAAPLPGDVRQVRSISVPGGGRLRCRGPRSRSAVLRRNRKYHKCPNTETDCGESQSVSSPVDLHMQPLHILCCNAQSLLGKLDELRYLADNNKIDIILVQEIWLDASIVNIDMPGFFILSRRDRSENVNRGGVLTFCFRKESASTPKALG